MARAHIQGQAIIEDTGGFVKTIATPEITVYEAGTTTPIAQTLYSSATGGATLANPFSGTLTGFFEFWVDLPQRVKIVAEGITGGETTLDNVETLVIHTAGEISLDDFRGVQIINTGVTSANAAFAAAFAYAGSSGVKLRIGPGTYLANGIQPPDDMWVQGAGPGTILKHPNTTSDEVIDLETGSGVTVSDLVVDGNRLNNDDNTTGWRGAEVNLGGEDNTLRNITVRDCNAYGFAVHGTRWMVDNCEAVITSPPATYAGPTQANGVTTNTNNLEGIYGFLSPASNVSYGGRMRACRARGFRSAGMVIGGTDFVWQDIEVSDCHREYFPRDDVTPANTTGGGQFGLTPTWDGVAALPGGAANQPATGGTLTGLVVGATPDAVAANGVEIGDVFDFTLSDFYIHCDSTGGGIIIDDGSQRIKIANGGLTGGGFGQVRITNSLHVSLLGVDFQGGAKALHLEGSTDYLTVVGCGFDSNTVNLDDDTVTTHRDYVANRFGSGTPFANQLSNGLTIPSGDLTLSAGLLNVLRSAGSGAYAATVRQSNSGGQGMEIRSASGNVLTLNTDITTAAIRLLQTFSEASVVKGHFGFTATDILAFLNAAGSTATWTLDQESGNGSYAGTLDTGGLVSALGVNANTTGAASGEVKTASHVKSGGRVYPSGQVVYGQYMPAASTAMTSDTTGSNANTISLGNVFGELSVINNGTGDTLKVFLNSSFGLVTAIGATTTGYTLTNAGTNIAVYWDSGTSVYRIRNRSGGSQTISAWFFGS